MIGHYDIETDRILCTSFPLHYRLLHWVFNKNTMSNEEDKLLKKRQKTLFECNTVKKVSYNCKEKSVLTDFEQLENKEMTSTCNVSYYVMR